MLEGHVQLCTHDQHKYFRKASPAFGDAWAAILWPYWTEAVKNSNVLSVTSSFIMIVNILNHMTNFCIVEYQYWLQETYSWRALNTARSIIVQKQNLNVIWAEQSWGAGLNWPLRRIQIPIWVPDYSMSCWFRWEPLAEHGVISVREGDKCQYMTDIRTNGYEDAWG